MTTSSLNKSLQTYNTADADELTWVPAAALLQQHSTFPNMQGPNGFVQSSATAWLQLELQQIASLCLEKAHSGCYPIYAIKHS